MLYSEIKSRIQEWITTGIPSNVKSFNLRTLLTNMLIRIDLLEPGRLKITKAIGNTALELEIGDTVYGYIENILVKEGIYLGGDQSLLSSYFILDDNGSGNDSNYFEYTDISDMTSNQLEQSAGDLCYVEDATDDDDVDSGDATYIYLGSENALLSDYRRLTDAELATLNNTIPENRFTVDVITDTPPTDVDPLKVKIEYDNGDDSVTGILFPAVYSLYLAGMNSLDTAIADFSFSLYNKTKNKWYGGIACGFTVVNTVFYKVDFGSTTVDRTEFDVNDVVEVYFNAYKVGSGNASTGIGTELSLANVIGTYSNMETADTNTEYTFNDATKVLGGIHFKKVNCASIPTVTGATRIYKGDNFQANKDVYLIAKYNGNRVEYWFEAIFENLQQYVGLPFGAILSQSESPYSKYLATPSIIKTSSDRFVRYHDIIESPNFNQSEIYYTDDLKSENWTLAKSFTGMFWGTLFEYNSDLYCLGVSKGSTLHSGDIVISKSTNNGETWSNPITVLSEVSGTEKWHTTSQPVLFKDGYLVKAFEIWDTDTLANPWAGGMSSTLVLANLTDLTDSGNWSYLTPVSFNGTALEASLIYSNTTNVKTPTGETATKGFLEGVIHEKSDGDLRLFLRLEQTLASNHGVYLDVSWNSGTPTSSTIGTTHNFIDVSGGQLKMPIIYDSVSDKLWTVNNVNRIKYYSDNRMESYLMSSDDKGLTWTVHQKVLGWDIDIDWESNVNQLGVQYASLLINGGDLIILDRTADENANDQHDANLITLTVAEDFRNSPITTFADGVMIIDENSERVEDANGISIIHDQSKYYNSPFMLTADNSDKVAWVSGLDFNGSEYMRIPYDRTLALNFNDTISFFVVVENIQSITGQRILSNTNGVNEEVTPNEGGWFLNANVGLAIEEYRGNYSDVSTSNDYIISALFDNANDFIYNFLNGANRGEPDSLTNTTWDTDHMVMSGSYSGTNFKEIWIGNRNVGTSLPFNGLIKAIHIVRGLTPASHLTYEGDLNSNYSIY